MKSLISTIMLFVGLVLLLVGCNLTALTRTPKQTIEDFYAAVEDGEIAEAMELVTDKTKAQTGEDKMKTALAEQTRQIRDRGGIQQVEFLKEDIIGETAEYEIQLTYGNGTTTRATVKLIEENERWKIDSAK